MIRRILLVALAVIPYALGWTTGKIAMVVVWVGKTVQWGWQDAHKRRIRKT